MKRLWFVFGEISRGDHESSSNLKFTKNTLEGAGSQNRFSHLSRNQRIQIEFNTVYVAKDIVRSIENIITKTLFIVKINFVQNTDQNAQINYYKI